MNEQKPRRPWRRAVLTGLAGLAGALTVGLGVASYAHAQGGWGGPWRGLHDADPQTMQRRAEAMVQFWLADTDASDAQRKQIAEIAATTMRELQPLRQQHRAAHQQAIALLAKPQIDRAALEAARQKEMDIADQVSRRLTQALGDAAEILTPEQRAQLAEKMAKRHGARKHG